MNLTPSVAHFVWLCTPFQGRPQRPGRAGSAGLLALRRAARWKTEIMSASNQLTYRMPPRALARSAMALALAAALAGCAVGPEYVQPETVRPASWKSGPAAEGWLPAAPADALDRG